MQERLSRRKFLGILGGGTAGIVAAEAARGWEDLRLVVDWFKKTREDRAFTLITHKCSLQDQELLGGLKDYNFSSGENNFIAEPAVAVTGNKLIVAAIVQDKNGKVLPMRLWVTDLDTGTTAESEIALPDSNKDLEHSGSDPVIEILPDGKVIVFSLLSQRGRRFLVSSVYNPGLDTWSHKVVDSDIASPDKPWFVWGKDKGWLTLNEDKNKIRSGVRTLESGIALYSLDKELKAKREAEIALNDDGYIRVWSLAFPAKDGIHVIYRRFVEKDDTNLPFFIDIDVAEVVFDPETKNLSKENILVEHIPYEISKEEQERIATENFVCGPFSEQGLSGLRTPNRGVILAYSTLGKELIVGYLGYNKSDWSIQKVKITEVEAEREKMALLLGLPHLVLLGKSTIGLRFLLGKRDTNTWCVSDALFHTVLLREEDGNLKIDGSHYLGPYPCEPVKKLEIGDYIQVVSDLNSANGVPFVSFNNNGRDLKVRLFPALRS